MNNKYPEAISSTNPGLTPKLEETIGPDWAAQELQWVDLGDKRLTQRCEILLNDFGAQPMASIPPACGTVTKAKEAYDFFDNSSVEWQKILAGHRQTTQKRLTEHSIILAVQDTTTLNHSTHPDTEGIGPIGKKVDHPLGLMLHSTLAFTCPGLPLGILDVQCWGRNPEEFGKKKTRHERPIEEKESQKGLTSLGACQALQAQLPAPQLIPVSDRESDIYELFELALRPPCSVHLLVRAQHNGKRSDSEWKLWECMNRQPVSARFSIEGARKGKHPKREATLQLRYAPVILRPPPRPAGMESGPPLTVWAIWAEEVDPLVGVEPIAWRLLTTWPVTTAAEALEKVHWYTIRWQIELFHKVLKSGCKAEQRQLETDERLERCLIVDMLVAWRILLLTKLGREVPNLPASTVFDPEQWQALYGFTHKTTQLPDTEPSLKEAILMVAKLGGFLARKRDGDPGSTTLWRGLHRLNDIVASWKIFHPP